MNPIISEEKLEEELLLAQQNRDSIRLIIKYINKELEKHKSDLLEFNLEVTKKNEELKTFRKMFPNFCKLTKE